MIKKRTFAPFKLVDRLSPLFVISADGVFISTKPSFIICVDVAGMVVVVDDGGGGVGVGLIVVVIILLTVSGFWPNARRAPP